MVLFDGILLHTAVDSVDHTLCICRECHSCLSKLNPKVPPLALAAGTWVGDVPEEYACLTLAERVLIGRSFVKAWLVKLSPNNGAGDGSMMMDGLVGNILCMDMPHPDIKHMVNGQFGHHMPQPLLILSETISVTFIGCDSCPIPDLRGIFAVSRQHVGSALRWPKQNNTEYHDIIINEVRLDQLPVDDVPTNILVRSSADVSLSQFDHFCSFRES